MKVAPPADPDTSFTTLSNFQSLIGAVWITSMEIYGDEKRYIRYADEYGVYARKMHKMVTFPYWKLANTTATNTLYKDTFPNNYPY